jgi:glutathionyl-hydroquinone reductase
MITASTKDKILFYLCAEAKPEQLSSGKTADILKELELDFDTFNAVMVQFQRFGFIEDLNLRHSDIHFILRTDANDFAEKGGFAIQDEIFKANIEKLGFEIDNLRKQLAPDKLDTLNKISSIASALFGGLALLPKG